MPIKLSIITINFENAIGLKNTIISVVNQTSIDFEYIIIDGASTDDSVEVIRSFTSIPQGTYSSQPKPYPIAYWISEPDCGIYHAMNKGIKVAKGEYCQFLNSGDWLVSPDVISKMLTELSNCSIFYGNMLKLMPNGKVLKDTCGKGNITMFTFYRGALNHSPALIKRKLFDKYGLYDETLKIVSDWKWYLFAIGLHNETVRYIDLDVTYFDMNGISSSNSLIEIQERRQVLQEILPPRILADYDAHWQKIEQGIRFNRHKIAKKVLWFVDRLLFKWEKVLKYLQE